MCGIVGALSLDRPSINIDYAKPMTDKIAHRGPDDAGYWCDVDQRIGLGHRRLSIVDLSSSGHQPMQTASGRFVIAFNGEIYNYIRLRKRTSVHVTPRASLCTSSFDLLFKRGELWSLCSSRSTCTETIWVI